MSGIMNMFVATKTTIATAVDAFFNSVSLLLNTSSTNGAQNNTFLDSSTNNFTITRNGNTTQGTFTPFSQTGWSNYFNGSSDYLTAPDDAALNLSGDFTIEAWVFVPNVSGEKTIFHNHPSDNNGIAFVVNGASVRILAGSGGSWGVILDSSNSITANSWNHIAATRNGNTYTVWINGVSGGTTTNSLTPTYSGGAQIGRFTSGLALFFSGYMSNLRVIKGTALYTSSFTPSTTPLTAVSGTSLLTAQDNRFKDNSTNAFALTVNGTPSVQAFSPFLPTAAYDTSVVGGSGYFDGSGDYLTCASSANLAVGTGDFTYEFWLYPHAANSDNCIFDTRAANNNTSGFAFLIRSSANLEIYTNTANLVCSGAIKQSTWQHVALVRSGSTVTAYVNGVSAGSATFSNNLTDQTLSIASYVGAGSSISAYISGFRVVKGTAVYTATFTPPTSPATVITNTQLLLSGTNSGIYDSAAKNVLETVGNAQVSTTQAKWGTTSMYFDGTGDWLITPNGRNYINGTEPFTIEFWVYLPSTPNYYTICGAGSGSLLLTIQSLTTININPYGSGNTLSVTTSLSTGTWTHIAATRDSSNRFDIWVNGVSAGNTTSTQSFGSPSSYIIGAADSGGTQTTLAYIDDFRISKFCRYTTTFTPPTAALPTQ